MKDYLFIDMHLHSSFSDEDLCDESPEHILKKVQGYCDKFNDEHGTNASCVISISDHNSILGSVKAREALRSGKYPNVKFINGCEFTVDLCELNDKIGIDRCFTRCHLLGYNYDENNQEMLAYSKVAHKHFSNEDNIGLQICAARRAVCEKYHINIPFSAFLPLADLPQKANYVNEFMKVVKAYFNENGIEFKVSHVYSAIEDYLISASNYVEHATSFGRIKLSEAMKLIHDAGGNAVLAHPANLNISLDGLKSIIISEVKDGERIYREIRNGSKSKPRIELARLDNGISKVVLRKFLDCANSLGENVKIEGMETFYGANFVNRNDYAIYKLCQEQGLFETCGSDYHGENFTNHKTIGNVFQQYMQRAFAKKFERHQSRGLFVRLCNIPYVDMVIDGDEVSPTRKCKFIDEHFNPITFSSLNDFISEVVGKPKEELLLEDSVKLTQEQSDYIIANSKQIKSNIVSLISVAEGYGAILNKSTSYKERRKLLLRLEMFCQSIYGATKKMQEQFREHAELFSTDEYKQIQKYLKEIHRKYYEMLRLDNGIIYDLQKSLKKQYGIEETTIDKIANITIQKEEHRKDAGREG